MYFPDLWIHCQLESCVQQPSPRLDGTSWSLFLLYWFYHSQSLGPPPGPPPSEQQARGPVGVGQVRLCCGGVSLTLHWAELSIGRGDDLITTQLVPATHLQGIPGKRSELARSGLN